MSQEQKELLIKDLCGRLPYGIFVEENRDSLDKGPVVYTIDYHPWINDCKPYLRPMESMTEEEEKEFQEIKMSYHFDEDGYILFDWLNKKGFDYRGLIPMGLALPALEGMYR